jgi:thiamine pyrophosphokinase
MRLQSGSQQFVVVAAAGVGPRVDVPAGAVVIAADGGLERAQALGLEVAVAVGDFDSASAQALLAAEQGGTRIVRHPAAKDATDLELALDEAVSLGAARVLVVASDGGRLDHLLGVLLLLGAERYRVVEVDALVGEAAVAVVRGSRTLTGVPGSLLTLLPLHGTAHGVTTTGLEYPLTDESLECGSTRGVSNVFVAAEATVTVERGVLIAIRPGGGA